MISAGDFRNGVTLEIEGNVYQILEFQHVKPGKGAAFVRTKLKNIINGGVVEKTFRPTEKFPAARIDRVDMQYLYSDGDLFHFMNVENYDQIALNSEDVGDSLKFVKENEMVKICSHNGNVFAVQILSRASKVIPQQVLPNRQPLRLVQLLTFRCSLRPETRSRSTPEPVSICPEFNSGL